MKNKTVVHVDIDIRPVRAIDSLLSKKGAYKRSRASGNEFAVYADCDLSKSVRESIGLGESELYVVAINTEDQVFFIYSSCGFEKVGSGRFESSVSSIGEYND